MFYLEGKLHSTRFVIRQGCTLNLLAQYSADALAVIIFPFKSMCCTLRIAITREIPLTGEVPGAHLLIGRNVEHIRL